jgi:hypothetical protein
MNQSASKTCDYEWPDYYERFPYFSAEAVRDGCHPDSWNMRCQQRKLSCSFTASPTRRIS